jgi:hypothetical protein
MGAAMGRLAVIGLVLTFSTVPWARAGSVTVIGNYPETNDGNLSAVASLVGNYAKAVGFKMGAEAFDLSSVTLRLAEQPGSTSSLSVTLFGGTAAGPSGPQLVGFDTPSIPTLASNVTFTPTGSLKLASGATYWLEVSGQSDTLNGIKWYASSTGKNPTGLATSIGALFTTDLGVAGSLMPSSVSNTFEVTGSMEIITIVPEPRALLQGAVSMLAGLLVVCWRRGWTKIGRVREAHQ